MGLCCWVKCQSCSRAVFIVQLRDHQSSPGWCIVTVWVLTCFINQGYWIASCYFYSQWHDLPARGPHILVSLYWPDALRQECPPLFLPHTAHTFIRQCIMHTHTFQHSGMVYSVNFLRTGYLMVAHKSLQFFPQTLSVNKSCLRYWAREHKLKQDAFHLSTAIMLPIRWDVFISIGRDVWLDSANSCAMM